MNEEEKGQKVSVRLSPETKMLVLKISQTSNLTFSEVLRDLIDEGLCAKGYKQKENQIQQMIAEVLTAMLDPAIERLAAINAKTAQIAAADFFMSTYVHSMRAASPIEQERIRGAMSMARSMGIQYLKTKGDDATIDSFIEKGAGKMLED